MNPLRICIVLCIDASDLAIGVILMDGRHAFSYKSCELNLVELNYPIM